MNGTLLATAFSIGYSVVILWRVSMLAREQGRFAPLIPFFLWAILVNALGAFIYYSMFFTFWWSLLDFAFFFCYALLLVTIIDSTRAVP